MGYIKVQRQFSDHNSFFIETDELKMQTFYLFEGSYFSQIHGHKNK